MTTAANLAIAAPRRDLLDALDHRLIAAVQGGLPLVSRPYQEIARRIGTSESEVITRLRRMLSDDTIKRLGVVVRHRKLGYRANAMVVWDVPDEVVDTLGYRLRRFDCITLCYRRPRRLPVWPYNLFCMIHGQDRAGVLARVEHLVERCDLHDVPHEVLFSGRCFKQRGAMYQLPGAAT
ncbi:MAG: AsnC family transcriptional regulator [Nitrospirota bacterium]